VEFRNPTLGFERAPKRPTQWVPDAVGAFFARPAWSCGWGHVGLMRLREGLRASNLAVFASDHGRRGRHQDVGVINLSRLAGKLVLSKSDESSYTSSARALIGTGFFFGGVQSEQRSARAHLEWREGSVGLRALDVAGADPRAEEPPVQRG